MTPQSWVHETEPGLKNEIHIVVRPEDDVMICECYEGTNEERAAYAKLIAAAPELLAALHKLLDTTVWMRELNKDEHVEAAVSQALDAINKATTGETI